MTCNYVDDLYSRIQERCVARAFQPFTRLRIDALAAAFNLPPPTMEKQVRFNARKVMILTIMVFVTFFGVVCVSCAPTRLLPRSICRRRR
jgi:hypothetical protein